MRQGDRILSRQAHPASRDTRVVVPSIAKAIPDEFKQNAFSRSSDGGIYIPADTSSDQVLVETDISKAPKEHLKEERPEYFGFAPEEIERVRDAHRKFSPNLYTGHPDQQAIYISRLMEAAGFSPVSKESGNATTFVRGAAQAIAIERAETPGSKLTLAREGFLAEFFAEHQVVLHPSIQRSEIDDTPTTGRRLDREGNEMALKKRVYKGEAPYQQIALLFMPEIWGELRVDERCLLVDSISSLYQYTANPSEIYSPEVFLRCADIIKQEKDVQVRALLYLLFDTVPYEIIPREAKEALAETVAAQREYQAPIAIALLTDPAAQSREGGALTKLRDQYLEFRGQVLDRVSGNLNTLAQLSAGEWVKLLKDIDRLNLLTITDNEAEAEELGRQKFGIEFEFAPYSTTAFDSSVSSLHEIVDRVKSELESINRPAPGGLEETSRDLGCVEVRTRGATPLTAEQFKVLRETTRAAEHHLPADLVTFHLHAETSQESALNGLFKESKHNLSDSNKRSTFELRSFRPPTLLLPGEHGRMRTRSQHADILLLERAAIFSTVTDVVAATQPSEERVKLNCSTVGLPAAEGVRKILSLSLCGDDPIQRVAAIQLAHRPPLFMKGTFIAREVEAEAPPGQAFEYLNEAAKLAYKGEHADIMHTAGSVYALDKMEAIALEFETAETNNVIERVRGFMEALPHTANQHLHHLSPRAKQVWIHLLLSTHHEDELDTLDALFPFVRTSDLKQFIGLMRSRSSPEQTEHWAYDHPDLYERIRPHLDQTDREYLFGKIIDYACLDPEFTKKAVLKFKEDALLKDRAVINLLYTPVEEWLSLRQELTKEALENDKLSEKAIEWIIHRLLMSQNRDVVIFALTEMNVHHHTKEVLLDEFMQSSSALARTLLLEKHQAKSPADSARNVLWGFVLHKFAMEYQYPDLVREIYPTLDSSQKIAAYKAMTDSMVEDEFGKQMYAPILAVFKDFFKQEQDLDVLSSAFLIAMQAGFLDVDVDFCMQATTRLMMELPTDRQEIALTALAKGKDPKALDIIGQYFPYRLGWDEQTIESVCRAINSNLGLEGRGFLLGLYGNNPTPLVRRVIEKVVPNLLRLHVQHSPRRRMHNANEQHLG